MRNGKTGSFRRRCRRIEATGRGVQYGLQEFFRNTDDVKLAKLSGNLEERKSLFRGWERGVSCGKISSGRGWGQNYWHFGRDGALLNENGLSVQEVFEYKKEHGKVEGFRDGQFFKGGKELLEHPCDVLIPAAMEGVIDHENAPRIQANVIAEAANGPLTYEADEILCQKETFVIPDAYLNAGGVTVSYFEWIKNLSHVRFGRMDRRFAEAQGQKIVDAIESGIGKKLDEESRKLLYRSR